VPPACHPPGTSRTFHCRPLQDPSFRVWKHNSYTQYSVNRSMLHLGLSYEAFARALLSIAARRYCPVDPPAPADSGSAASEALEVGDVVPASVVSQDIALRLLLLHLVSPLAARQAYFCPLTRLHVVDAPCRFYLSLFAAASFQMLNP
jgi:hypothetical protein